jgi:hypothetical protein
MDAGGEDYLMRRWTFMLAATFLTILFAVSVALFAASFVFRDELGWKSVTSLNERGSFEGKPTVKLHTRRFELQFGRGKLTFRASKDNTWYPEYPWWYQQGAEFAAEVPPSDPGALSWIDHGKHFGLYGFQAGYEFDGVNSVAQPSQSFSRWQLALPIWAVAIVASPGPLWFSVKSRSRRRRSRRRKLCLCPRCGYDCRATPDRCSECGYSPATVDRK